MNKFEIGDIFRLNEAICLVTNVHYEVYAKVHGFTSRKLKDGDCIYHFKVINNIDEIPGLLVSKSNERFFFASSNNGIAAEKIGKSKLIKLLYKGDTK